MKGNIVAESETQDLATVIDSYNKQPFAVTFDWGEKAVTIALRKGEDVFRLAELYKIMLDKAKIGYVETDKIYKQD